MSASYRSGFSHFEVGAAEREKKKKHRGYRVPTDASTCSEVLHQALGENFFFFFPEDNRAGRWKPFLLAVLSKRAFCLEAAAFGFRPRTPHRGKENLQKIKWRASPHHWA